MEQHYQQMSPLGAESGLRCCSVWVWRSSSWKALESSGKGSTPSGQEECLFSHIHSLERSQTEVLQAEGEIKGALLTQEGSSTIDFYGIRLPWTIWGSAPLPSDRTSQCQDCTELAQPLWFLYRSLLETFIYLWDLPIVSSFKDITCFT